jgi:hypothetical protein
MVNVGSKIKKIVMNGNEWVEEANQILSALLAETEGEKKIATIRALATAKYKGHPKGNAFKSRYSCSLNTYHTKWKLDPTFAAAEAKVLELVDQVINQAELEAIALALHKLRMATPQAADTQISLLRSENDFAALKAAHDILSHASNETAPKSTSAHTLTLADYHKLKEQAESELAEWTPE